MNIFSNTDGAGADDSVATNSAVDVPPASAIASSYTDLTICGEHTHEGVDLHLGDTLTVPAQIADFLVAAGSAKIL